MSQVIMGPRCNHRVTCDTNPSNARSESDIAVNPLNPYNMVGASKRFTNPSKYEFSLATYATFDGGLSWTESMPLILQSGWTGTSDPTVAWDNLGNAYLIALPFAQGAQPEDVRLIGIAVYKSTDGGRTWGQPTLIHSSSGDDKQWATSDINPNSPYYGNVYCAWDDGPGVGSSKLAFARTTDHGMTWKGIGNNPAGTALSGIDDSGAPELSIASDGTIYIVWITKNNEIKFVKSTNGGDSFSTPKIAASGITPLPNQLPGAKFRVFSLPTGCAGRGDNLIFAWADYRDGVSRIYYCLSTNGGNSWEGSISGRPLLTGGALSAVNQHEFHPQIINTPNGEIGCAFYEFGPKTSEVSGRPLINVVLTVSTDNGASFPHRVTVTDQAWDPEVDAPLAHGDPNVTFIGDYFGLDASRLGFFPFWTDTRTGVQEIFTSRIAVEPTDVYIRDTSSDIGAVPYSSSNYLEAPDLIVRHKPDGDKNFVNQDVYRDGVTDHYVYARVSNKGPNTARNVTVALTVGNQLAGTEFRYPLDWYPGNWNTPDLQANHLFLGESGSNLEILSGESKILGPVVWPAAKIPDPALWRPCLLAEVRADNENSAGGINGCDINVNPNACADTSYFWGNNNICQQNLKYANISETFNQTLKGDYVAKGIGMRNIGQGQIDLTGMVPPGSTIVKAFLYWSMMEPGANPSAELNGHSITGTLITVCDDPCWGVASDEHVFFADVTGVATDGVNKLTKFPSGAGDNPPLLEGASLVLIYTNPTALFKTIIINHGGVTITKKSKTTSTTLSGFNAGKPIQAKTTYIVADGQAVYTCDQALFNKTVVAGPGSVPPNKTNDAFDNADGEYWDTLTVDVTSLISNGDTTATATIVSGSGYDCLTYIAQIFSVTANKPQG